MCLGVPMRLVKIEGDEGVVESSGLRRKVNVSLLANVRIGDYILIHAGFAIEKVKEKEAKKTLEALKGIE